MNIKTGATPDVTQLDLNRTQGTREAGASSASDSTSRAVAPGTDSIALSPNSNLVQLALASQSAARAARVAELQKQFESGQYHVDAQALSRALIAAHLAGQ